MDDIATLNVQRAYILVDQLYQLGIRCICLSPGSRSTPLAIAVSEHENIASFIHFDERGLAFHALGYAKASGTPVALIVTSGTAVANLLPAVVEASFDRVPLILITADRPAELRDCGANQTVDQVHLFRSYVRWEIDLPFSDPHMPTSYLTSSLAQGVYRALHSQGPVHINCMIREPLFALDVEKPNSISPCCYESCLKESSSSSLEMWAEKLSQFSRGIIIAASEPCHGSSQSIEDLGHKLGWPIFSDILSPIRSSGQSLRYGDLILRSLPSFSCDAILHLGDRIVSKTMSQWIAKHASIPYFQVTNHPYRQDPLHKVQYRIESDPSFFCRNLLPYVTSRTSEWVDHWRYLASLVEKALPLYFSEQKELTEPSIPYLLSQNTQDMGLFISNSMPIRDADLLFFPKNHNWQVFGNRGASGIDGNIATACGIASALQKPTVAWLGDLAALHDLNSLAQCRHIPYPILFLVMNNHGGGIFSFLPVARKQKFFESFFATSHPYSFEEFARGFSIPYCKIQNKTSWDAAWEQFQKNPITSILEIQTDRSYNVIEHQNLYQYIDQTLCSKYNKEALLQALTSSSYTDF